MSELHESESNESRRPGRPRSDQAHRAILDATLELVAAVGFQALSIEQVAAHAAVGKQTIYRRWHSKEALVADAIRSIQADMPVIVTGKLRDDLITMYRTALQALQSAPFIRPLYLRLVSEYVTNPALFQVFLSQLVLPRFRQFVEMVEQAQARGEIRQDIDLNIATDLLIGPMLFRWIATDMLLPAPASDDFQSYPEQIVNLVMECLSNKPE